MRWKRELRRVRNIRVGIRERSEFKLVERKKIAHGVSRGETARSTKPRHGAKDRAAAIFRPLRGLCGTRPIPMARAMGYFLSPCGLENRSCVLATHGFVRAILAMNSGSFGPISLTAPFRRPPPPQHIPIQG